MRGARGVLTGFRGVRRVLRSRVCGRCVQMLGKKRRSSVSLLKKAARISSERAASRDFFDERRDETILSESVHTKRHPVGCLFESDCKKELLALPLRSALLDEGSGALDTVGGLLQEAVCSVAVAHSVFLGHLGSSMNDVLGPLEGEGSVLQALFSELDGLVENFLSRERRS